MALIIFYKMNTYACINFLVNDLGLVANIDDLTEFYLEIFAQFFHIFFKKSIIRALFVTDIPHGRTG